MNPGQRAEFSYRVTAADTAAHLGSGDVAVLGPRVLALMERATVQAVARSLEPGDVRGGNRISARPRPGQARFAVRG
jgi:fluoroacetyl-CoA thioesterase